MVGIEVDRGVESKGETILVMEAPVLEVFREMRRAAASVLLLDLIFP